MDPGNIDIQSKFVHALRTQGKAEYPLSGALPCPYPGHDGRIFQSIDQLYDHAKAEHVAQLANLKPSQAREKLRDEALKLRRTDSSSDATAYSGSPPDMAALSLDPVKDKDRRSPPFGKKRPVESEGLGRRGKPAHVDVVDADYNRNIPHTVIPERTRKADARIYDPNVTSAVPSSVHQPQSTARPLPHRSFPKAQASQRQPGPIDLQRYRYPGLLLEPDSRPISQEQLASEVKSFYAGLTMVETKSIHVDRTRTAALEEPLASRRVNSDGGLTPSQATESYVIPCILEHRDGFDAIGDYCAKKNFMTKTYADRLGLFIDRTHIQSVLTGSGNMVRTIGSVTARFRFKSDPEVYALTFEILSDCIHDLILGKQFLRATSTFSSLANRARRVVTRIARKLTSRHVLFLGDSAPMFTGTINGHFQKALADSGCKVLLMDEDYAEQLGLLILRGRKECIKLRFADNCTAMSSGIVKGVRWSFGTNDLEQEYLLDFHVLKNAPAPVILSEKLLFDTAAYSQYEQYLEDEDDEDEEAYFLAIDVDETYQHGDDSNPKAYDEHAELVRRGEEEDRIAALPASKRNQANLVESQRRADWDVQSQRPSSQTPPTANTNHPQNGGTSTPLKSWKTGWRLKLRSKRTS